VFLHSKTNKTQTWFFEHKRRFNMKLGMKKITWVVIIVMIGLLSLTAITAASDIDWPWSSDPGTEPQALAEPGAASNRLDEGGTGVGESAVAGDVAEASEVSEGVAGQAQAAVVTALQPDDNGYTGPIIESNQVDLAPSGGEQTEEVDWDALIPEGDPDQVNSNAEPNWSGFYYYHVTGSALHPRNSAVEWNTGGSGGCLYQTSGDPLVIYNLHQEIPTGARIDYLRIFYYDTSASNSSAWVTNYDDEGGYNDVTSVQSAGSAGYGTSLSAFVDHIVDNTFFSYILNWRPYVNGSTMQLCGLRVAYRLP
jgi:hypothetical protein